MSDQLAFDLSLPVVPVDARPGWRVVRAYRFGDSDAPVRWRAEAFYNGYAPPTWHVPGYCYAGEAPTEKAARKAALDLCRQDREWREIAG